MGMPKIDLETLKTKLPPQHYALVEGIVATRGKNKGCLRASKPPVPQMVRVDDPDAFFGYRYEYEDEAGQQAGMTAYVWRMVAFAISPNRQHSCMPVMCEIELPGSGADRRALAKMLDDEVVKVVVDMFPLRHQYGTMRWGYALGYL